MTEAEVEQAIAADPDAAALPSIDWDEAEFVAAPAKTPISIRLDDDVLDFFKSGGPGYQKRINAVLRSYVEHALRRRTGRKPAAE